MFEIFKISEHVWQKQQPEPKVLTERTDGEVLHNPTFYIEIDILGFFQVGPKPFYDLNIIFS
jgi:hypothetical protein